MLNALTIDLEDWAQAVLDTRWPITDRVVGNVRRLLGFLDAHGVRATFFALGKVCEQYPQILPAVAEAGHEIATHGYGHKPVHNLALEEFTEDLARSIEIIKAQTGRFPIGYRAPRFSINRTCLWAGPILVSQGIRYSSSIFPIRARRHGIPDWPRFPDRWPNCDLIEFPITTFRVFARNLPICGGGYTRLLPAPILAHGICSANRRAQPAVLYLHPYELAVGEVGWFRRRGFGMSWSRRLTQSLWRSRVASRVSRLLREFRFTTMSRVLDIQTGVTTETDESFTGSTEETPVCA